MIALSVSEVSKYIKQVFVSDSILSNIYVKGEVSNYIKHTSGHMYFTLKDKNSRLRCVMFSSKNRLLNFEMSNGMEVIANGYISVYERDGAYQLYVNNIQPDGIGSLYLAFEQLKNKLEKEGLFNADHKKKIPILPKNIGLITSTKGAAVKDFLTVVKRRFPNINVTLVPVLVQGSNAAAQISNAIDLLNRFNKIDIIVITRGGGSIEELWSFNEEIVARSIYNSKIPVVSAVGHERDFTIADFVADLRAPTPSAAGELTVPVKKEIEHKIEILKHRTKVQVSKKVSLNKNKLLFLKSRFFLEIKDNVLQKQQEVDHITRNLNKDFIRFMEIKKNKFFSVIGKLDALSPLKVLDRGYSITRRYKDKKIVREIYELKEGDVIETILLKGQINSKVFLIKGDD